MRTIRAWETEHRRPATPILALTASTLDQDIPRAFAAGCNAHIAKPVRKATLLAAIVVWALGYGLLGGRVVPLSVPLKRE